MTALVEAFKCQAAGHGAVAHDGDGVTLFASGLVADGEAKSSGDRRGRMRRAEQIVRAFARIGKARDAVPLAQRRKALEATGQQLVHVDLVANVKNEPVMQKIKDAMQGNG